MSKKPRFTLRDDSSPRFTCFWVPLFNCSAATTTLAPPMKKIPLPYQVLPGGRILAAQLLKIELSWSPAFAPSNPSLNGASFNSRLVLDAIQQPPTLNGQLVACDPSTQPDWVSSPLTNPSVVGFYDRTWLQSLYTDTSVTPNVQRPNTSLMQNSYEEHYFGCCGEYPVIPSGGLHVYGYITSTRSAYSGADLDSSLNTSLGYTDIFKRTPDINYPQNTAGWSNDNANAQPYVQCRLWYRIVELTAYQHIMIVQKYTNKVGMSGDESYDKLLNTGPSSTNPVYPNVPLNPLRTQGGNITPWMGS